MCGSGSAMTASLKLSGNQRVTIVVLIFDLHGVHKLEAVPHVLLVIDN
jgi:hypothetical protein